MAVTFVPRSTWHPAAPTNNNGSTRPKLARPVTGGLAVHYTGSPIRARNSNDDPQTYMLWQQARAQADSKSFEYNYIIPPRTDGTAQVWEYAGDYMAAHAGSINNPYWIAVQFAIGVNNHPSNVATYDPTKPTVWQQLEPGQIEAFRWLRADLVRRGMLRPVHQVLEHRQLPTAATICPGDAVRARWADLLATPAPPNPPGDDMALILWRPRGYKNVFITDGTSSQAASSDMIAALGLTGKPVKVDPHRETLKSVLHHAGLDLDDLTPEPLEL